MTIAAPVDSVRTSVRSQSWTLAWMGALAWVIVSIGTTVTRTQPAGDRLVELTMRPTLIVPAAIAITVSVIISRARRGRIFAARLPVIVRRTTWVLLGSAAIVGAACQLSFWALNLTAFAGDSFSLYSPFPFATFDVSIADIGG